MPSRATSTGGVDGAEPGAGELSRALRETLELRHPAVAIAFVSAQPEGVETFDGGQVPSACTFWRRAEERLFFAPAEAHMNCPIGAMTMGFAMTDAQQSHLMELVGQMGEIGYVDPAEAANIPAVPGEKSGIVYGPLEGFPLDPDVVLAWVSGRSAMLLDEATGASTWTPEQTGLMTYGRPSCAAVAMSVLSARPTMSVGCSGMRIFTGIDPDLNLAVLPREILADLPERLTATVRANAQMADYYNEQKQQLAAAT
ncbi:MAG TPA: DUF169 domain-containing protein [Gaiellaceae bacterium]|jgi:uncharacterized protein (DUF169 family)